MVWMKPPDANRAVPMPDTAAPDRLLTVKEVAARLQVSEWTVRTWLKTGALRGAKVARKWRIPPEALRRFLDQRTNGQ